MNKATHFILISVLFCCVSAKGQFTSKTYFKHNDIDGWIKYSESNWYTIDQKGDTTFCQQVIEENNQDDPNIKPKYEINGAGYIVQPAAVKAPDVVRYVNNGFVMQSQKDTVIEMFSSVDTMDIFHIGSNEITVKYRDRYKKVKPKKVIPKKRTYTTTNFIEYKKNLYLVAGINGQVLMIDESNEKRAKDKFRKLTGKKVLSITQFFQSDIIK